MRANGNKIHQKHTDTAMQYTKINEVQLSLNEMCRQKNEQDRVKM